MKIIATCVINFVKIAPIVLTPKCIIHHELRNYHTIKINILNWSLSHFIFEIYFITTG
jgi:hypothetical protein